MGQAVTCVLERCDPTQNYDASDLQVHYQECDLAHIVTDLELGFLELAKSRSIAFATRAPKQLLAHADRRKMTQALAILLFGAFKHTPVGGFIELRLEAHGDDVRWQLHDNGPPPPHDGKLGAFERSRLIEKGVSKTEPRQMHLLADARDYFRLHGGELTLDTAPRGASPTGAALRAWMPRWAPIGVILAPADGAFVRAERSAAHRIIDVACACAEEELAGQEHLRALSRLPQQPKNARPRLLVVEDSPSIQQLVYALFKDDFDVTSAFDGRDGLNKAIDLLPDVALVDLKIPGLDGQDVVTAIRQQTSLRSMRIIVMSATHDVDKRTYLLENGVDDFVTKPFSPTELRARVRHQAQNKLAVALLRDIIDDQYVDLMDLAQAVHRRQKSEQKLNSQLKSARDAAEASNRIKSNFLHVISHELRTPVTALSLNLRLLADDRLSKQQQMHLKKASIALDSLQRLFDLMSHYCTVDAGLYSPQIAPINLYHLVETVVDKFQPALFRNAILVNIMGDKDFVVQSDETVADIVVSGLLEQAILRSKGDTISVSIIPGAPGKICIADSGEKLSTEEFARLFDAIHMSEQLRWGAGFGSGVGLSVINQFASAIGASLHIEASKTCNEVSICLPNLDTAKTNGAAIA